MDEVLPLTLVGDNLGKRHYCFNALVNKTYERNIDLNFFLEQPERTPLDRIFKIELASKHRDVDYIVNNLKDKDMLFVSKALKCQWMLECKYIHIINPVYLEDHLYPMMTTTAVSKMKNMIKLNLKDAQRCQDFYEYYKSNFDVAIKFLWHCREEYIRLEVLRVMDKLSPKHLQILCEACPVAAKIYFENLHNNKAALERYLKNIRMYHKSIMNVLKVDTNIFLDVIEKYFNRSLKRLSPSATGYIMKNHKHRYLRKPELYAGWILNVKTLELFLSSEEIKDIVIRLARAQYLGYSLTYKHVEPFLKRLSGEDKISLKKMIFVDKSFGDMIKEWPCPSPVQFDFHELQCKQLRDTQHNPYEYEHFDYFQSRESKISFNYGFGNMCALKCAAEYTSLKCKPFKSSLEILFDRYRFVNFDKVFFEFHKLLMTESSIEGRRNMILVLVSKAGGNEVKVKQLLKFLVERHSNEPDNLRDAVARSMVKRAFAWRLSADTWELLLKWATTSVREILHSTILRNLLANLPCSSDDLSAYLLDFSDLSDYSLNADEKSIVAKRLPALLVLANAPNLLLDTLGAYRIHVESVPGALEMLITASRNDKDVLRRVFTLKVARRYLLKESFKVIQTDAAYMNALKHDVTVLRNGDSFVGLLANEKPNHDRFLRSLALYFSEHGGLAACHFKALEKACNEECKISFARPMAYLLHADNYCVKEYISKVDRKSVDVSQKKFAAALRANALVARPLLNIDDVDWHTMGGKLISNKVLVCCKRDLEKYIQMCLQWRKTLRAALNLARRNNSESEILPIVVRARPTVALNFFLADLRKDRVDVNLWNEVKVVIQNTDFTKSPLQYVKRNLANAEPIAIIKAEFWTCVFEAFHKVSELEAMPILCRIENLLTQVHENSLNKIITEFLETKLNKDLIQKEDYPLSCVCLYFRIIAKYLLTSNCIEDQKIKIQTVCGRFFDKLELIFKELDSKSGVVSCLTDFIMSLKYTEAFLDSKYVCCIPIFEEILKRLPKLLPREIYFKKYVYLHVTMLYYKSIVHTMKGKSEFFSNQMVIDNKCVQTLGFVLGKNINKEIQELIQSYFGSILEIYQKHLLEFFNSFEYNDSREKLVASVIKGLIQDQSDTLLLALYVFEKESCNEKEEILKLFENTDNEEMKFFLYASIYPY